MSWETDRKLCTQCTAMSSVKWKIYGKSTLLYKCICSLWHKLLCFVLCMAEQDHYLKARVPDSWYVVSSLSQQSILLLSKPQVCHPENRNYGAVYMFSAYKSMKAVSTHLSPYCRHSENVGPEPWASLRPASCSVLVWSFFSATDNVCDAVNR